MRDFWDNIPFLAGTVLIAFIVYGFGYLLLEDMERGQVRYEQCIAADKQWVKGSCVK